MISRSIKLALGWLTISVFTLVALVLSSNTDRFTFGQLSDGSRTNGDKGPSLGQQHSRMRVLLLKNTDAQHAVEEAASLSVDLPSYESSKTQEHAKQAGLADAQHGHRQVSLASLTLHQQEPREQGHQQRSMLGKRDASDNQTNTTATSRPLRGQQQPDPWVELSLQRIKPSWLNVNSRFKITGNSIEEIDYMMPAEYLLRSAFDSPILLKTKLGILEGVRSIKFNKHLYTFLSVPYARPPVGERRFKAPERVAKWDGILQATKWPPFCVQPSMTLTSKSSPVHVLSQIMTEDCLYLNIWTPSLKYNKMHKRPVMVWMHGGAFQYGGISVDENDGSALALLGDVVVVTLNYRISAFGFLNANNPQSGPNNVGILDQRMALEWVQANIRQFGGDPQQVTLFGESAGAHSVGIHMISPPSQQLFKRAILQSGVPISYLRSYDVNPDNKGSSMAEGVSSIMMAKRLKCYLPELDQTTTGSQVNSTESDETTTMGTRIINETTTLTSGNSEGGDEGDSMDEPILNEATLECMRNKSSIEILKAMGVPNNAGFFPTGNDPKGVFPNGPIQDSFDPDNLKVGPQKDYLLGTNTDEGTFMLHYGLPAVFPARDSPKVDSMESLKKALLAELERMSNMSAIALNTTTEIQSASGSGGGGAQSHLYKPLLRTSSTVLQNFMPKSQVRVLENGTVVGNTSYYSKEIEFSKNVASLITDIIFLCPARSLARTLSESGRNVYFYLYTHRSSLSQYHDWIGVTHHDEVEFVFGRPIRLADVYSGKDIEMSQRLIKTWAHFARTGQMLDQMGTKWPKYNGEDANYMTLASDQANVGQRYQDKVCNIYDTVISVHLQDG